MKRLFAHITRLKRCESGAPMVEFAIILPVLLLFIAVIIEGGRITWIHQATAGGVRDASRMIARIAPLDLCNAGTVGTYDSLATTIVTNQLGGSSIMPGGTTVVDVTPTCIPRVGTYRVNPASIVEVTAEVEIDFIFGGIFGWFGNSLTSITTVISDQSRVYGV
ncbi:TadE/TadG family type IV pilus assembly protein [Ruegeria sp. HKCCA5426]|uniref:TadE/TadG family type IV pilus assembly protein n=1 Tax=Ruegeria sp. HKCCA5426 TaxID=2682985 RepID=UPI00148A04AB